MSERKLLRTVIKEEFVALTGDPLCALILNQMLYWTDVTHHHDKLLAEEKERMAIGGEEGNVELKAGWIYKSAAQMAEETQLGVSPSTVSRRFLTLVEKGWLKSRRNPNPAHQYDKTLQYRVDLIKISQDLREIGYELQGWKLDSDDSRGRTVTQPDSSIMHSATSMRHGDTAIPEITSEITKENKESDKQNAFKTFCDLMEASGLEVSPEDRKRVPGNLKRIADKLERGELGAVLTRMVEARRDRGYALSPQQALNDVRLAAKGVRDPTNKKGQRMERRLVIEADE